MAFSFIRPAKIFLSISGIFVVTSLILVIYPGPLLSIEFTGGSLMEITGEGITKQKIKDTIQSFESTPSIGIPYITSTKDGAIFIRTRNLSNEEHMALNSYLQTKLGAIEENQFTTIGPTVGASMKQRSFWALLLASIGIIIYIAFAFRKVPRKLSPWRFGVIAVITLLHDVLITIGVFIVLSHISSFEVDTLFITALLTIMGYSVNDTIIIFDRIRDNLFLQDKRESLANIVERSLHETLTRSFNTSFSTLIMLFSLYFFGSDSIQWFILTLIVGMIIGSYSSIFLAAPLLVLWRKKSE